ncbi:MAG: TonB-dependent receptor plug [Ferruginibacter sp.]|nr:TonB-dependent receptor plug [Ferruginibacter sp.]
MLAAATLMVAEAYSQIDTVKAAAYEDLSLKDLLNLKIVSVSKNSESLFDAPLSASVITKEDIRKTGCTSIMEALRLIPGMIVREQSNGNYDIHLRGMDNVPPNSPFDGNATTTLVMIDSRPIYNYLKGGTFWETLPVDINDVEKIEEVRGPAAALYGPNAVSGVINIITRQAEKNGLYLVANAKQGSYQTFINNASVGFRSKKWSVVASGNYQGRNRTQTSYFEMYRNRLLNNPSYFIGLLGDTTSNVNELYPDPSLAMEKYGGNIFLNYHPSEKTKIYLTAGVQHSMAQTVSAENGITPLSTVASDSRYADLRVNIKKITAQVSYNEGTQITNFNPGNKYDFHTLDANIEYNYTKGKFSLKPGLSYRSAIYDDTKYSDIINKTGIFNGRGKITSRSASLRGEYKLIKNKLRLVAGLSANTFNYPDTTCISYEFATTYKLNKNHLFRAVYSRSPRSSTIYDTYIDQTIAYYQSGYKKFTRYAVESNKNLKLLTADMLEIGYRGSVTRTLSIDVEVFDIRSKNYNSLVNNAPYIKLNGGDTLMILPLVPTNLPLTLRQQGITVSIIYNRKKLQVKPFVTVQQSRAKNYSPFLNMADAPPGPIQLNPAQNNIYSGMGNTVTLKSTPVVFGGVVVNYVLTQKFNFNLNAYYYAGQTYTHVSNTVFNDGVRGIDHIPAKLILNANVSYEAVKGLQLFCSAKNMLNNKSREFFKTDAVPFMLLGGLNFTF